MLDVACGSGRHVRWFAARGARVTALDRDAAGAGAAARAIGAEVVVADIESAPWPLAGRRFDAVVVTNYLWRAAAAARSSASVGDRRRAALRDLRARQRDRRQAVEPRLSARRRRTARRRRRVCASSPTKTASLRGRRRASCSAWRRCASRPAPAPRAIRCSRRPRPPGTAKIDRFRGTRMKPIVGSIVALVTPMREDGSVDYDALRALIDWHIAEGTRLHRRRRHDRRIADRLGRGALGDHPRRRRARARPRADHGRHRRQLDAEAIEHSRYRAQGRRRLHALGRALLQQAVAGRHLPPLPRDRRGGRHPDGALQRARADGGRHAARDRAAPGAGAGHRRHQGGDRRHRPRRAPDQARAAGLLDLFGRRRQRRSR